MLINQGYHLVDLWQYLFGLPEALYADIPYGKYNDFAVDDEATLVMDYPGRMTGTFIMSTGEGVPTERLEIVRTRGSILMDGTTVTVTRFYTDIEEYARHLKKKWQPNKGGYNYEMGHSGIRNHRRQICGNSQCYGR